MSHPRQAIRLAVVEALKDKTSAQDRVSANRMTSWTRGVLPGISVYTLEETSSPANLQTGLSRTLTLAILGVVDPYGQTANVDDALDDLAQEIETAMAAALPTQPGRSFLTGTQMAIDEDNGRQVGAVRLTYQFTYRS